MSKSKVSIIVPVYNVKDCLIQCVESLVNQDYKDIEILLIDDGSTDGSAEICDRLQNSDNRIKVIHKENEGQGAARNLGIQECSGDYVMFIDSDDWLDLDAISTLVSHMETNELDVARYNYIREYGDKSLEKKNTFLEERVYVGEECKKIRRQIFGLIGEELGSPENTNFLASACFNIYNKEILTKSNVKFKDLKIIGSFEDGLFNFEVFAFVNRLI